MHCRLTVVSPKESQAAVLSQEHGWHAHPYRLTVGCCPTKNNDRFEWFVEKATELGVDVIVPLIGDHSERKVYKPERARRIALSATKQSLKAAVPQVLEPLSVRDFLAGGKQGLAGEVACGAQSLASEAQGACGLTASGEVSCGAQSLASGAQGALAPEQLKLIAYCFEDPSVPRISIQAALKDYLSALAGDAKGAGCCAAGAAGGAGCSTEAGCHTAAGLPEITVLIGPEGDFSPEEAAMAVSAGYLPVHLGPSRLRTETAAITAAEAVYLAFC